MERQHASVWADDRRRRRDRRTAVAIVAAVSVGIGLGVVAGVAAARDFVIHFGAHPELGDPSTVDLVDGFDALHALQVGGVAGVMVGMVVLALLRGGALDAASPRDLTRRRALIVGGIGVIGMALSCFFVGVGMVAIAHTTSGGHVGQIPAKGVGGLFPTERFYIFDPIPAVIAMLTTYGAVTVLGSLLRRSR